MWSDICMALATMGAPRRWALLHVLLLSALTVTNAAPKKSVPDFVDPDTPADARITMTRDGRRYRLVFSDEFERENRTFREGEDPKWTAINSYNMATKDFQVVSAAAHPLSALAVAMLPHSPLHLHCC